MRGKRRYGYPMTATARSIPACAGEAASILVSGNNTTVYPRVCGGSHYILGRYLAKYGLSPRVRGKRCFCRLSMRWHRSIPACAGEADQLAVVQMGVKVYPRVCGGSESQKIKAVLYAGLSPRVRGKQCSVWAS